MAISTADLYQRDCNPWLDGPVDYQREKWMYEQSRRMEEEFFRQKQCATQALGSWNSPVPEKQPNLLLLLENV